MEKLIPEKLYAVATWSGAKWVIIRLSINISYEKTKKWIEDNFEWVKGKEYLIVEYLAR